MAIQTAADNQVTVLSASWNNGSTALTAFRLDVNNILTPPTSRLFDVGTNTGTYTSRFVIDVSGSVGIGTTNPTGVLHISGSSTAATPTALIRHGVANGSSSPILQIQNSAGSNVLFVSASGDIGINGTPTNFASYNYLTHYGRSTTLGGVFQSRTSDSSFDAQFYVDNGGGAIASNVLRFFTNSLERMRIDNSGIVYIGGVTTQLTSESVRIGRASVQNSLLLNNTAVDNAAIVGVFNDAAALAVNRNTATGGVVNVSKYTAELVAVGTTSTSYLLFSTSNAANVAPTERVRIDATGNVGVGITNPGYKLDVVGQIKARNLASGDTTGITLGSNGVEKARIQFTASDDSARFKMEVAGVNSASERLSIYAGPLNGVASNEALVIGGNGNVGIGTGTLITSRLLVTGSGATSSTSTAHFVNSSGTSILFVRDDGNVGIGTNSVTNHGVGSTNFAVNATSNALIDWMVNGTRTASAYAQGSITNFGTVTATPLAFLTQNSERVRIDSSGNVGIGVTNPAARLQVNNALQIGDWTQSAFSLRFSRSVSTIQADSSYRVDAANTPIHTWVEGGFLTGERAGTVTAPNGARPYFEEYFGNSTSTYKSFGFINQTSGSSFSTTQFTSSMAIRQDGNVGIGSIAFGARLFVSGSSSATTPTMIVREGVVSPTGGALLFDAQNSTGTSVLLVSGSGNVGINMSPTSFPLGVFRGSTTIPQISAAGTSGVSGVAGYNLRIDTTDLWQVITDNNAGNGFYIQYNNSTGARNFAITTAGNVGIGSSSPTSRLDVLTTTGIGETITQSGTTNSQILALAFTGGAVGSTAASAALFRVTTNSGLRPIASFNDSSVIDAAGSFAIGTTSTTARLTVSGSTTSSSPVLIAQAGIASPSARVLDIKNVSGTTVASVDHLGNFYGVSGSYTGDVTISGNLTVAGSQTIVNSDIVNIKDNIILLNSTASPQQYGGIYVADTTANTTGSLRWNSSTDRWEAGLAGSEAALPTGSGTTGYLTRWASSSTFGNSAVYDDGSSAIIGATTGAAGARLHLVGGGIVINDSGSLHVNGNQNAIVGASRRLNYGDLLLGYNLRGQAGDDTYRTHNTHAAGYAGLDLQYTGIIKMYSFSGATTAGAAVTPNQIGQFDTTAAWLSPRATSADFYVNSSGNVGVGTASPSDKFQVGSTASGNFRMSSLGFGGHYYQSETTPRVGIGRDINATGYSSSGYISFASGGGTVDATGAMIGQSNVARSLGFLTSTGSGLVQRGFFDGSGNFGIGTGTSLTSRFLVTGSGASSSTSTMNLVNSSGTSLLLVRDDGNIGMGVAVPTARLFISGSSTVTDQTMLVKGGAPNQIGPVFEVENNNGTTLFVVSGSTAGNVGIGTGIPSAKFEVVGVSGSLFSVTDNLSGSLFSVNTISGLPILEVFSDNTLVAGAYNTNALVVTGSRVGVGTSLPSTRFEVSGQSNQWATQITSVTTTGQSYGLRMDAGTNSTDAAIQVRERLSGMTTFYLRGDGNLGINNASPTSRLFVSGSSTASTPTMIIREGVVSPAGGVGTFDVQNSAGTSLLFVSGSGYVGIGTNSSAYTSVPKFNVVAGNDGRFALFERTGGGIAISLGSTSTTKLYNSWYSAGGGYYKIGYNGTLTEPSDAVSFVQDTSGNVGIGSTTTSGVKLHVSDAQASATSRFQLANTSGNGGPLRIGCFPDSAGFHITANGNPAHTNAVSNTVTRDFTVRSAFELLNQLGSSLTTSYLDFRFALSSTFSSVMTIWGDGNIGIGTTNTNGNRLAISGGNLSVTGSVLPGVNNTYDLGSTAFQWRNLYFVSGSVSGLTTTPVSTGSTWSKTYAAGESAKITATVGVPNAGTRTFTVSTANHGASLFDVGFVVSESGFSVARKYTVASQYGTGAANIVSFKTIDTGPYAGFDLTITFTKSAATTTTCTISHNNSTTTNVALTIDIAAISTGGAPTTVTLF